jgi:hypothetical protein
MAICLATCRRGRLEGSDSAARRRAAAQRNRGGLRRGAAHGLTTHIQSAQTLNEDPGDFSAACYTTRWDLTGRPESAWAVAQRQTAKDAAHQTRHMGLPFRIGSREDQSQDARNVKAVPPEPR